jgi:hypothetical protein
MCLIFLMRIPATSLMSTSRIWLSTSDSASDVSLRESASGAYGLTKREVDPVWSASVYRLEFSPNRLILWASDARKEGSDRIGKRARVGQPAFPPGWRVLNLWNARSFDGGVA